MKNARPIAILLTLMFGGWCAADEAIEEVIVEVPHMIVKTEVRDYGVIRVRYRATTAIYDEVAYVHQTREISPRANGFGVELGIKTSPRKQIRIAEAWTHPNIRHRRSPLRKGHTVMLHTLDPPDVYSFYFPLYEYSTTPAGEWKLQLLLMEESGAGGQNLEVEADPTQLIAGGAKPFFEFRFELKPD